MSFRPYALAVVLAAVGVVSPASAQEVFGTLRRADIDAPARGAIVVAERLGDRQVISRAVTGIDGTWRLRLTTDRLVLRALRIGFEPYVLDTVQLAAGERRELSAVLPGTSVVLPTVRTATDDRCRVRPDSASLVARLFDEARTALAASQLISLDGPIQSRVRITDETWSHDEKKLLETTHREYFSDSLRPFGTASVDSLLEFGFVTRRQQRYAGFKYPVEVAVEYRVPSVDLLVDDRFLADYCLHLADARDDHPDWIGVGFRPGRIRRITQIEGTLWLDRHSAELQRIEFGYAGLTGTERLIEPGGWLEFTRLASGLWFVNRWALRMPALGQWMETSGRKTMFVLTRNVPVVRVSGEVLEFTMDARAVYTVGATDIITSAGALVPVPGSVDSTLPVCDGAPGQAYVFGTVVSASGPVLRAADLRFFWRDEGVTGDVWLQSESRTQPSGQYRACGLPQDLVVTVEVRAAGHEPAAIALRVGAPRREARLDLVLVPAVPEAAIP